MSRGDGEGREVEREEREGNAGPRVLRLLSSPGGRRLTACAEAVNGLGSGVSSSPDDSQESEVPVGYDPGRVITEEHGVDSCLNPKSSRSRPLENLEVKL
ncbi:unnamed protein product [Boreogadus saida]